MKMFAELSYWGFKDVNYNDTRCWDCGVETNHLKTNSAEWYMVSKDLWHQAMSNGYADFLCIGCLEKRIGRILNSNDFPSDVPLNSLSGYLRSKRLCDRMGIDC